jgi:hypothetical protein
MNSIPEDLENIVISFMPYTDHKLVSKTWNSDITFIQKKAIEFISKWWVRYQPISGTVGGLIRCLCEDEFICITGTVVNLWGVSKPSELRSLMCASGIPIDRWMGLLELSGVMS